jgi:hypothetical protein
MWLEEKLFNGNNSMHFTSKEFKRYKELEEILLACKLNINETIVQTADEILDLVICSDYLLIEKPCERDREVKLPLVKKTYMNPIIFGEIDGESPDYSPDFDAELHDSILDNLRQTQPKYFRVVSNRFEALTESGTDDFSEIFEIGFIYLNGIISLAQNGSFSIKILDEKRQLTEKNFRVNAVLPQIIERAAKIREYEARIQEAIVEIIGCGTIEKLPLYNKRVGYEDKAIEERKKERH